MRNLLSVNRSLHTALINHIFFNQIWMLGLCCILINTTGWAQTKYWSTATGTSLSTAGNWNTVCGGGGSTGVPVSEPVVFGKSCTSTAGDIQSALGLSSNPTWSNITFNSTLNATNMLTLGSSSGSSPTLNLASGWFITDNATTGIITFAPTTSGSANMSLALNGTTGNISNNAGASLVISCVISGTSSAGITKTGTGTLSLSGTNTYAGKTIINGGLIAISGESKFGANPSSFIPDQLTFNGGGVTTTGNVNFSSNRGMTLNAGGGIFDATSGNTMTLTNIVTGTGLLTKTSPGILTMAGPHTYTGGTTITAGTLNFAIANSLSTTGTITLNGGTLGTTNATAGFSEAVGPLNLTANSTIALGTGNHTLSFAASSAQNWISGKVLTITGWAGASYSTGLASGTAGKIFIGSNASGLTATQLSQICFYDGTTYYPATILSTGEIVPTLKLVITTIYPVTPTAGSAFSVTVQVRDFNGNPKNAIDATAFSITTNGNAGTVSGTLVGTILAGGSSFTITNAVILPSAGTLVKIIAIRTSGDNLLSGTSTTFSVNCVSPDTLSFGTQPTNVVQDATMTAVTVRATCSVTGLTVTGYSGNITLSISAGGCGYVSQTAAAVNGVATFNTIKFDRSVQTGITLSASASGLTGSVSNVFNVTAPTGNPIITTIVHENFDGSSPTWPYSTTLLANTTNTGNSFVGIKDYTMNSYGNSTFEKSLVKSHTANNSSAEGESTSQILFNNVTGLAAYNSVQVSFLLGSLPSLIPSASGNGIDANENMVIETSIDGGSTWNTVLTYYGFNNYLLPLSTSSPVNLSYNANASYNSDHSNSSTQSSFVINLPGGTSQFAMRMTATDNREEENWAIDNILITGTTIPAGAPKPLPSISANAYTSCPNSNTPIAVDLTNTQSVVTYAWAPPTYISGASTSGPVVYPPSSQTYTVTATDIDGCSVSASDIVTVLPLSGTVTLADGSMTAVELPCTDSAGWTYYADPADMNNLVFAIYKNGNTFSASVDITVKTSTPVAYDLKYDSICKEANYTLGRYWNATLSTGSINGASNPIKVRFFYNAADTISIKTDAINKAASWGHDVTSVHPLQWFKTNTGITYNPINNIYSNVPNRLDPSTYMTATGTVNGVSYIEYDNLQGFSGGTGAVYVSPGGFSLPVKMLYINATGVNNDYIKVNWATTSEINNTGFEIERSTDGMNFEKINWLQGNGNSSDEIDYSINDNDIIPNVVYYYRLKQIDADGKYEYTAIVSASIMGSNGFILDALHPNPATNQVIVNVITQSYQSSKILVTDIVGRMVSQQNWELNPGLNGSPVDISNLASGTYIITVMAGDLHFSKKLMVSR